MSRFLVYQSRLESPAPKVIADRTVEDDPYMSIIGDGFEGTQGLYSLLTTAPQQYYPGTHARVALVLVDYTPTPSSMPVNVTFVVDDHVAVLQTPALRSMPVLGSDTSWVDPAYGMPYPREYDRAVVTRSGYLVAYNQAGVEHSDVQAALQVSVWKIGGINDLADGAHRARGYFA